MYVYAWIVSNAREIFSIQIFSLYTDKSFKLSRFRKYSLNE